MTIDRTTIANRGMPIAGLEAEAVGISGPLGFLAGGGEMGARMRAKDWSTTPLGPASSWPQSLRTSVALCLSSRFAILLWWGPELAVLYNDHCVPFLGAKHPAALGSPARESWLELWDTAEPRLRSVSETGEAIRLDDRQRIIDRNGYPEECYFTSSYSPIRDESGAIVGIFTPVVETTEKIIAVRRLRSLRNLASLQIEAYDSAEICRMAAAVLDGNPYDVPFALLYRRSGTNAHLVGTAGIGSGERATPAALDLASGENSANDWPLARVFETGETELLEHIGDRFGALPDGAWGAPPHSAILLPVLLPGQKRPDVVLIAAISPRKALDDNYRSFYRLLARELARILARGEAIRREHELRLAAEAAQQRAENILESITDGFFRLSADWRFTYVNSAAERILQRDRGELLERNHWEVYHGTLGTPIEAHYRRAMAEQTRIAFDNFYAPGQRWFEIQVYPSGDGGLSVYFRDATQRRQAEEAMQRLNASLERRVEERTVQLLASQAQIRLFFDHSSESHAVFTVTDDGKFIYEEVNPTLVKLYGKAREEVVGHTVDEVLDPANALAVNRNLTEALLTGRPRHYERSQGNSVVEAIASPVPGEKGQPRRLIVSARDVTESRRLEERLRQAQKMEAIGQLTGGVAHDFNNLLQIIIGNLETLGRRLQGQAGLASLERPAFAALRGAERAAVLTQQLLAFSRRQPLDPKPLDPNQLVASMSELLRRTLGEAIRIETVLAGGLWRMSADANQLENALLNLAVNARDAMPEGGRLTIETANAFLDENYASVQDEVRAGQYVLVAVSDTGKGMPKDIAAKAFEPFFTTKEIGQGTGLGLSQVYGFAKQSGGHVKIYSEPGAGTTVKIYLPRHVGTDADAEIDAAGFAVSTAGAGESILVVEDDPDVRGFGVEMLRELGYAVVGAADGAAALRLLDAEPRVRLLFTDVGLPGELNGRQLADEALKRRPDLKILFTTGYARNAIIHHGRLDAGVELLPKPFTYASLAAKVRGILKRNP